MANFIYNAAKNAAWGGGVGWTTNTIKAVLVDSASYTPDQATHDYLDDVPVGARVSTSSAMTGKAVSAGWVDCDDFAFSAVPAGGAAEYIVFFVDSGVESTSLLLFCFDTATGLPVTPDGNNINVAIGPSGLVRL